MTAVGNGTMQTTAIAPYLSRLALASRSSELRRDLANSQALHRRMLDAFPFATGREQAGLLYRIDPDRRPGDLVLLTQSILEPDWSRLPPGYTRNDDVLGWDGPPGVQVKTVGHHYAAIEQGSAFAFRLRANPVKREPFHAYEKRQPANAASKKRREGPRIALRSDEELQTWMMRKGEMHGFRLGDVRFEPDPLTAGWQIGSKRVPGQEHQRMEVEHTAILFSGWLRVTDPDRFREALVGGIGPGKAYGFGLLSIAPGRE